MGYSLKLINEVLRVCEQERVPGIDLTDIGANPLRVREILDAYDTHYEAFLLAAQPFEARKHVTLQPLSMTQILPGDTIFTRRHALPEDGLGLAEDPKDLAYEVALETVNGHERRVLRSNCETEISAVIIRRVDPDALSPVAFLGAALQIAVAVSFKLSGSVDLARDIRGQLKEWKASGTARKHQGSARTPRRVYAMDGVRFRGC